MRHLPFKFPPNMAPSLPSLFDMNHRRRKFPVGLIWPSLSIQRDDRGLTFLGTLPLLFIFLSLLTPPVFAQSQCAQVFASKTTNPTNNLYASARVPRDSTYKKIEWGLVAQHPGSELVAQFKTQLFSGLDYPEKYLSFNQPVPDFLWTFSNIKQIDGKNTVDETFSFDSNQQKELNALFKSLHTNLYRLYLNLFSSHVDSSPLNHFLDYLNYLHHENPDLITRQIFGEYVGSSLPGSDLLSRIPIENRRILYHLWLQNVPKPEQILTTLAGHLKPFSPGQVQLHLVGNNHFLESLKLNPKHISNRDQSIGYMNPTEHNPQSALSILKLAPAGAYIGVGTLRTNIGASLTPNVTHMIRLDIQQGSVEFGRMDTDFLRLAETKEDYVWLVKEASFDQIQHRIQKLDHFPIKTLLKDGEYLTWFRKNLNSTGYDLFFAPAEKIKDDYAFKGANYIHDDIQFKHLSSLAKAGRIANIHLDLSDISSLEALSKELQRQGISISVLDISDTWYHNIRYSFIPKDVMTNVITTLKPAATDRSILLMTSWYSSDGRGYNYLGKETRASTQNLMRPMGSDHVAYWKWNYFGFTFQSLGTKAETHQMLERLNNHFSSHFEAPRALSGTLNGFSPDRTPIENIYSSKNRAADMVGSEFNKGIWKAKNIWSQLFDKQQENDK